MLSGKRQSVKRKGIWIVTIGLIALIIVSQVQRNYAENQGDNSTMTTNGEHQSFTNTLGMRMIRIPAGKFQRRTAPPLPPAPGGTGCTYSLVPGVFTHGFERRFPPHEVEIAGDFYLAEFEVTNGMYRQFVEETGYQAPRGEMLDIDRVYHGTIQIWDHEQFNPADHPVVGLIQPDGVAFCQWLSEKEGRNYRLPTVEEWEYACRAGTETPFYWGPHADVRRCNYQASRINHTLPVGSYEPNPWGLYDMIGNAAELTATLWGRAGRYYIKGGSWCHPWWWLDTSSFMATYSEGGPTQYSATVGFRLACDADPAAPMPADIEKPLITAARPEGPAVAKLKIEVGERVDLGRAPTNEATLLTCWDPDKGPAAGRTIWILYNKRSTDGGKTWQECDVLPHTATQLSDGTIMAIGGGPDRIGRFTLLTSQDGWKTVQTTNATMHLPQAEVRQGRMRIGLDHGLLELDDGTLLATGHGYFEGDMEHEDYTPGFMIEENFHKARAILLESSDRGENWQLRATIANYPSFTREGCDEPDIVLLPNGDLFCAMRTGLCGYQDERHLYDEPVFIAWSRCLGKSWSDFEKVYVGDKLITGIFPRIVLLDNGVLAFLRSRPHTSVVFNPDGTGRVWTDEIQFDEEYGAMNALRQIGPNELLAVYVDERIHYIMVPITVTKQ